MFANIRWYNALFVGFAPMLALPFALWLVWYRAGHVPPWGWPELLWGYVAANLAYSCLPSRADVDIVLSKPLGLAGWLALAGACLWWWTRGGW
jgi:hypothetical protein